MTNSISGELNPSWRDQIRKGVNATTSLSGTKFSGSPGMVLYWINHLDIPIGGSKLEVFRGQSRWQLSAWQFTDTIAVPTATVTRVTNRVISKFLSDAKSLTTAFEAGQDFGEYKETLRSIHRPMQGVRNKLESYFTRLTKTKFTKKPVLLHKALADAYLEFKFGVAPLAADITDLLTKCGSHRWPTVHVKSSAKENYNAIRGNSALVISGDYSNSYGPNLKYQDDSVYSIRYRGAVRTNADPSGKSSEARELQLLPNDWLPTAWDLLPYSWMVDYFVNVGEILQALSFIKSDLVWAEKSVRTVRDRLYSNFSFTHFVELSGYRTVSLTGGYNLLRHPRQTIVKFQRTKLTEADLLPSFEFRIPKSRTPFDNIGALILSRTKRLVPFF
jgi:hypothetical protein